MYHTTPVENEDRIRRKGLIPATRYTSRFRYIVPRVYLFTRYDPELFDNMMFSIHNENTMPEFYNFVKENNDIPDIEFRNLRYVVFRIDTSKFSKFNIFQDDMAGGTTRGFMVYTLSHIPTKAIQVHEYRSTAQ